MPLDPVDSLRLGNVEQAIGNLTDTATKLAQRTVALNARLRVVEARNKALWTLSTALFLLLLGSVFTSIYWAGSLDASLKAHAKRMDEANAAIRDHDLNLREHERRASVPKSEGK